MTKQLVILLLTLVTLSQAAQHEIANVPYYDMTGGFCTPTAIRMNLAFYGVKLEPSIIQNLGWDYGFQLRWGAQEKIVYPTTDPVDQIKHAAETLGFTAQLLTHPNLTAAKKSLTQWIDQDVPVLVQWIPHTVLAYGYQNDAERVRIHDPKDVTNPMPGGPFGHGAGHVSSPQSWTRPPVLWNVREYLEIVLKPSANPITDPKMINWKKIWKRNAERTLGGQNGRDSFGTQAIRLLSKNFSNWYSQDPSAFMLTFYFGMTSRRDAAAFLFKQSEGILREAAMHFSDSASLFEKAHQQVTRLKNEISLNKREENLQSISEVLYQIAVSEEVAASLLQQAAE